MLVVLVNMFATIELADDVRKDITMSYIKITAGTPTNIFIVGIRICIFNLALKRFTLDGGTNL